MLEAARPRTDSPGYGPAGSPPLRVEAFEAFPWRFLVAIRRSLLPMLELWHSADGCSFVHRRRPRKVSRGAGREPMHAFGGDSFRDVWRVAAQICSRGHHRAVERPSAVKRPAGARRQDDYWSRCAAAKLALGRLHVPCPGESTHLTADACARLQCRLWFSSIPKVGSKIHISYWSSQRAACAALGRARHRRGGSARVSAPALAGLCVGGTAFCELERVTVRGAVRLCQ